MASGIRPTTILALIAASLVAGCSPPSVGTQNGELAGQETASDRPAADQVEFWLGVPEPRLMTEDGKPVPDEVPANPHPMPPGDLSKAVIRFTRCCAGFVAPDYHLELRGNGQAEFVGNEALMTGAHRFRVAPNDVHRLVKQLEAADFWGLDAEYECGISHATELSLTVEIGGASKKVVHRCGVAVGLPQRIVKIEKEILAVADAPRWLTGNEATLAQLAVEGFQGHSTAAADLLSRAMQYSSDQFLLKLLAMGPPLDGSRGPVASDAAYWGRLGALQALAARGAFAPHRTGAKEEALESALGLRDPAIVAEILKHRPDVDVRFKQSGAMTPIELAAALGDAPKDQATIIHLLAKAGADPSPRGRFGDTPLHYCMQPDIARALIAAGADIEARDEDGNTPLLDAYDEDMALLLIKAGANIKATDKAGVSVADMARRREWPRVIAAVSEKTPRPAAGGS